MTRFVDKRRREELEIDLKEWDGTNWTPDWSADFFEVGSLEYDEWLEAYEVPSVRYLLGRADDWMHCRGDFCDDYDHNCRRMYGYDLRRF